MEWFEGQVSTAIAQCKQLKGVLVAFVRDEESTSGEVEGVLNSDEVSQVVTKQPHVAIVVRKESQDYKNFSQTYPVAVVPSVFFINTETGFPLQIVRGSISVSDFVSKISRVFEKHEKLLSTPESLHPDESNTDSIVSGPEESSCDGTTASQGMSEAAVLNKEEKMKRAEELLKQKREQRAEEEFQAEKNREMKRRSAGKELSDAARAREQKANETWMQERQQAKEEDKKARAEVLAKLEQDKEERRRAREDKESELRKRHSSPTSSPPSMSSRSSGTTRLQFRVQKGSPIVQEFNSSDQLIDARTFIAEKLSVPPEHISLSSTFPSRPLPETSNEETLSELGLCPSSVIIVKTKADIQREMSHLSVEKDRVAAKRRKEEEFMKNWLEERQRAKEEDKKLRTEILAKVETDKEERRRAREDKESKLRQRHSSPTSSPPSISSRSSDTTHLQFCVQKGSPIVQEFNSSDQLIDARTFIAEKLSAPPEHISLSSTFPSRPLPETSNEETLSELGLCPSSVIIVKTKVKSKLEKEKCDEASSRSSGTARLQFRVHNSSTIVQEFSSSDQLIDARVFIAEKLSAPPEHISLSSTFPSRPLPETSNEETLSELGLCPSSVIIVKVVHFQMSSANRRLGLFPSVVGFFAGIFAFILYLLKSIASVFTSSGTQTTATQGQSDVNQFTAERRFKQIRQEDDKFDRDNKDDDEERRKTDNGNSTQQF